MPQIGQVKDRTSQFERVHDQQKRAATQYSASRGPGSGLMGRRKIPMPQSSSSDSDSSSGSSGSTDSSDSDSSSD